LGVKSYGEGITTTTSISEKMVRGAGEEESRERGPREKKIFKLGFGLISRVPREGR